MNHVEHPDTGQLIAYSEKSESSQHQAVGLHLATCGLCRLDLQAMTGLRQHVSRMSRDPIETSDETLDEMSDLIHNRLNQREAAELRDRIKQDPAMLREALHYARHHVAMQGSVRVPEVPIAGGSWWSRVTDMVVQSLQFEAPVWKMLPVAVVLFAVVAVFYDLQEPVQPVQVARLINFDDQPSIQFVAQESQPGIGFFANNKQTSMPFEGVSVEMENHEEVIFSWPAIENARIYHLKLQVFRNGETVILGRYSGKESEAIIKLSEPPGQYRYEWVLSGDTIDKQSFQTMGGFVMAQW